MKVKTKLIIGVSVIVMAVGALIFNAVNSSAAFYLKIDEIMAQKAKYVGENVKMSGKIVGESVQYDGAKMLLTFDLKSKNGKRIPITYHGAKPDTLNDGWSAIVQGKLMTDGTFTADKLLVKCPSKYEAKVKSGGKLPANDPGQIYKSSGRKGS